MRLQFPFTGENLNQNKKDKLENLIKSKKLLLNLSKSDSKFIKKNEKIFSKENKIFMSLYKKIVNKRIIWNIKDKS